MKNNICIILPVYNEKDTIHQLVEGIFRILPKSGIILVDDSDEKNHTFIADQVRKNQSEGRNIQIIRRNTKLGRGSAVLSGFRRGLTNKEADYFIEMDSDLSHDPKELPLFFIGNKADVIIGSRYLPQSKIVNWPYRRLILSRIINLFLRMWLRIGLTDYTNGYRLYSRKAIEFLARQKFKESGFIFLSESAYALHRAGFHFSEIPTTFVDRKEGKSSVTIPDLFIALIGAVRIRVRNML